MTKQDIVKEAVRLLAERAQLEAKYTALLQHVFVLSHGLHKMKLNEEDFYFDRQEGQWKLIADLAERWQRVMPDNLLRKGNYGVMMLLRQMGCTTTNITTDTERDTTVLIFSTDDDRQQFIKQVNAWLAQAPTCRNHRGWGQRRADIAVLNNWLEHKEM